MRWACAHVLLLWLSALVIIGNSLAFALPPKKSTRETAATVKSQKRTQKNTPRANAKDSPHQNSPYRGWDYIVGRLRENGVSETDLRALYSDPRMPERTFVPFSVKPREPASIYYSFKRPEHALTGAQFIERNSDTFTRVQKKLLVPPEVVASIIVIESQAGKNTGNHMIAYRLSRLATTNAPDNVQWNYVQQKKTTPRVTFADIRRRGNYLERTFLPEIPALLMIAKKNKVDVLSIKGSTAGAMGLPQFLPSAFMRYGLDGDKDGVISLHNETDAIWSAANYLAHFGFRREIPTQEKRSIIWRYNKSKSYIDTVLELSKAIDAHTGQPHQNHD
jgi:membrane-bound lytic murein transglycosylase B